MPKITRTPKYPYAQGRRSLRSNPVSEAEVVAEAARLRNVPETAPGTAQQYVQRVEQFRKWARNRYEPVDIDIITKDSPTLISEWLASKAMNEYVVFSTLNGYLSALKKYWKSKLANSAHKEAWVVTPELDTNGRATGEVMVSGNPAFADELTKQLAFYKKEDKERLKQKSKPFTLQDMGKVLNALNCLDNQFVEYERVMLRCFVTLAWSCWLRCDEAQNIRLEHLSFQNVARINGKSYIALLLPYRKTDQQVSLNCTYLTFRALVLGTTYTTSTICAR
jgi:hypothetical protein